MTVVERDAADRQRALAGAAITGWAVHCPGRDGACPPDRARDVLGRKGLLYKDDATRLALCAVHQTLQLPAGARRSSEIDPRTGVVVSSNFGNVSRVTSVSGAVALGSYRDVSPLDAPNMSSNVIASTVAIWFGFGGPNLTVCNGATGGLDAISLGQLLLRADRADTVVAVGVEPRDQVTTALWPAGSDAVEGAACVILERPVGARACAIISPVTVGAVPPTAVDRCLGQTGTPSPSGADGVLQVAAAAALTAEADRIGVVCGDPFDGWRSAVVYAAGYAETP
jgi:3-oxoacyl-[acyl-carrier-protein] synthase II